MASVTLIRRVTNANDRNADTMFYKKTKLVYPPQINHKILCNGKIWLIIHVHENIDIAQAFVELEPDHTTFKGQPFVKRCQMMKDAGFKEMNLQQIMNFRKEEL